MKIEWEEIYEMHTGMSCTTYRAKVFGGWLIMNNTSIGRGLAQGLVFLPDEHHEWQHLAK